MKRVFGDTLRSRARVAQTNELLLKVIVHNIVCLIHSMLELDLTPIGDISLGRQETVLRYIVAAVSAGFAL